LRQPLKQLKNKQNKKEAKDSPCQIFGGNMEKLGTRDYSGQYEFAGLDEQTLVELFRNGSVVGKPMEAVTCNEFGYKKAIGTQLNHDVVENDDKIEVRCVTKGGVDLKPSNQTGSGRKFNGEAAIAKLQDISAIVAVDIRNFPIVDFYKLSSKFILETLSYRIKNGLTAIMFDKLIKKCCSDGE